MNAKQAVSVALLAVTGFVLGVAGTRRFRVSEPGGAFPARGEEIALGELGTEIDSIFTPGHSWLLIVSANCAVCLNLNDEIDWLRNAAACADANVVPIVVAVRNPADSMLAVLGRHGLKGHVVDHTDPVRNLGVKIVPAVLISTRDNRVRDILSPAIAGSWPPSSEC